MAEAQSGRELPVVDQPAGIPGTLGEHARLMFDLQALAYETDLSRVVTFMMGREITGRTYAEIGVPDAHHPISHHQRDPAKLAKLTRINRTTCSSSRSCWRGSRRRRTGTGRCSTT